MDKIYSYIAYNLIPKRIAYWCYVRVHSHATVTKYTDRAPEGVSCFEAMEAWK